MKKKETKSLFSYEIKAYPKAHELSIALSMVGLNANIKGCETILRTQAKIKKIGNKFSISDAVDVKLQIDKEFEQLHEDFNEQR
jgi:hypothetical protein